MSPKTTQETCKTLSSKEGYHVYKRTLSLAINPQETNSRRLKFEEKECFTIYSPDNMFVGVCLNESEANNTINKHINRFKNNNYFENNYKKFTSKLKKQ